MSLLLGVHAERKGAAGAASAADAHEHLKTVALTGVAGLLAGAASMACGEWCIASASMPSDLSKASHRTQQALAPLSSRFAP